ncbi:GNAT family N-acetyltransferase [Taklimakanibacter deserti]|uniref:GNAT family N-acetyltransferase n=1 Tax=Taklimakanibacter deserti TaxID=2267839 RepID=UPI000E64A44C
MDTAGRIRDFRVQLWRYVSGSPRSRWRQNALLRELGLHHLVDIGIDPFTMQPSLSFSLRPATEADMPGVQRIYGDHVATGLASFEEAPPSVDDMRARFRSLKSGAFPYIVAERKAEIVGYAYAGPYRTRSAYRFTIENSVYVDRHAAGEGIGRALLSQLIQDCEKGPWRQMIAIIGNSGNRASIALHESLGFHMVGTLREVGFKHEQWVDTVLMQRALNTKATGN